MPVAFVLIKAHPGKEDEISKKLKELEIEASLVYGDYDFVAQVRAKTREELEQIISTKIRSIEGIESTVTLPAAED